MRRIISLIAAVFLIIQLCISIPAYAESTDAEDLRQEDCELNLYAQSAVLMDAGSGRILYGKNEDQIRPMASTTKIMTCIIALENGNMEDMVTATQLAASQPKVHLGVRKGETFRLKDLLYSLMLESHNDSAVMIAEQVGGSVEGFAAMMNQKARDLGCDNTYFITPNGLDASIDLEDGTRKEHSTTASDLSRIMRYCVMESPKKDEFLEITQTQNYFFTGMDGKRSFNCTNHNAFLSMMKGALSGKTGFTGGAGYSYIAALKDGDRVFVVSLLGCGWPPHKTYKWSDTRKLFEFGLKNFKYQDVFIEPEFKPVAVKDGIPATNSLGDQVYVKLSMNLKEDEKSLMLLMSDHEKATCKVDIPKQLNAPVREGEAVGAVTYYLEGDAVKSYPVYTCDAVDRVSLSWCTKTILEQFLTMPGFALGDRI